MNQGWKLGKALKTRYSSRAIAAKTFGTQYTRTDLYVLVVVAVVWWCWCWWCCC